MQSLMMNYQLTLDKILEHANRMYPHKRVITKRPDGSMHTYTYADMYKRVKRMSKALVKLGVQPGDRVGTFAWNNYQHLELYYAIPGAGAVCHTLNIRLFPDQLSYIVNHAEDKVVFIEGSLLPLYERVADQINCVQYYVLVVGVRGRWRAALLAVWGLGSCGKVSEILQCSMEAENLHVELNDTVMMPYTVIFCT